MSLTRRQILALAGRAAGLAALAACSPSQPPAPTKPVAAPTTPPAPASAPAAKPAEAKPAEAKPAAPAAPAASPAAAPAASPVAVPAASPAVVSKPGSTTPWRMALPRNMIGSPIMIGVEKGIFVKHGLDAKIETVDAANSQIKAVQVGEADMGSAAIGSFITGRSQDVPIKGYGVLVGDSRVVNTDGVFSIMASGSSGITRPADLKGKKLGAQAGTTLDTYLRLFLAKNGISPNDVEIQNVNQVNAPQALVSGVDAVAANEPYGELILATVPGAKLIQRGGGFIAQRVVIMAHEDALKKYGEVFERALTATFESMQYARKNPDEAADVTTRWLAGNLDPAVLRKAIRHHTYDPRITPNVGESWASEDKTLLEQKKIKASVPFQTGFDGSLAEKILKARPDLVSDLS